jgi:H/ACA ribonucleoprotein complex subunit 4
MAPSNSLSREQVASAQLEGEYSIKSEDTVPKLDTSQWPLLLKNYDKLLVRSSHFTPIPSGCSPLKRDISTYIKYAIICRIRQLLSISQITCQIGRHKP